LVSSGRIFVKFFFGWGGGGGGEFVNTKYFDGLKI